MSSESQAKIISHSTLSKVMVLGVTLLVAGMILMADLWLLRINVPILYIVPLLIYARASRRYGLLILGTLLAVLTLGRLILDCWPHLGEIWNYRLVNRVMVAVSLLACAFILQRWRSFQVRWEQQRSPTADDSLVGRVSSQTFLALKRAVVALVAGILIVVLALTDFKTPGQVNVPILYLIPLLMIGLIYPWRVTLVVLIIMLILALGGFFLGPQPPEDVWFIKILTNRFLACGGLVLAGAMIYLMRRAG